MALTAGQWRRLPARAAAITGWAGLALILLACTRLSATTLYPGIAALLPTLGAALVIGAGCAAPSQGCGRVLGLAPMRAIGRISYSWYLWHWPVLVLAPHLLGHPLGLAARLAAALLSGGLAVLTLRFLENPLRFAAPIRRSALGSLALGGAATAVAVCVGVALLAWVPTPVGHGAPAAPLTITAAPPPAGSNIDAYDAAVRQAFAQVQAAVAASADLKAVPSNLDPPLADAAKPRKKPCCSTAACARLSKAGSLSARRAIPPRRRRWPWSATRMPRCGIRRSSRSPAAALAAGDAGQGGLPIDGLAHHQPLPSPG